MRQNACNNGQDILNWFRTDETEFEFTETGYPIIEPITKDEIKGIEKTIPFQIAEGRKSYPLKTESDGYLKNEYRGISDIIHGMTDGNVSLGFGHFNNYWSKKNKLQKETWAQYGAITYENNESVVKMFDELFPNISKSAIKKLEKVNNAI